MFYSRSLWLMVLSVALSRSVSWLYVRKRILADTLGPFFQISFTIACITGMLFFGFVECGGSC
jgi:hypothetical protein